MSSGAQFFIICFLASALLCFARPIPSENEESMLNLDYSPPHTHPPTPPPPTNEHEESLLNVDYTPPHTHPPTPPPPTKDESTLFSGGTIY
nr:early nodulin-12-like [Ziziphus jujuba var. spinosa]